MWGLLALIGLYLVVRGIIALQEWHGRRHPPPVDPPYPDIGQLKD